MSPHVTATEKLLVHGKVNQQFDINLIHRNVNWILLLVHYKVTITRY